VNGGKPEYVDLGKVALWPNREATGNEPVVTGKLEHGPQENRTVFRMSFWKNDSKHPQSPTYDGKIQGIVGDEQMIAALEAMLEQLRGGMRPQSDRNANAMRSHEPPEDDFDDDIPF
jgi:hypothetical protein